MLSVAASDFSASPAYLPPTAQTQSAPVAIAASRNATVTGADAVKSVSGELSDSDRKQVDKLKQRDAEVRRHEQAHKNVGGQYAGAISYDFQKGPDGRSYAVGGEVPIDVSPIQGDPQATIDKMDQVRRAALAPAEPSAQDRSVAATAQALGNQARVELREVEKEEAQDAQETGEADKPDQGRMDASVSESDIRSQDNDAARETEPYGPGGVGEEYEDEAEIRASGAPAGAPTSPFDRPDSDAPLSGALNFALTETRARQGLIDQARPFAAPDRIKEGVRAYQAFAV